MVPNTIRVESISIPSVEPEHALGTVEELRDFGDAESALERLPDVGSHAVAPYAANLVRFVEGRRRAIEKIARCFANVHKEGRFRIPNVVPELGEGKLATDGKGDTTKEAGEGDNSASAMVPCKRSDAVGKGKCMNVTYMGMQSYQRSPPGPGF